MSTPKYVYAVLKLSTEEVVLVTDSKNDVKDFMSYRPKDNYSIAKITKVFYFISPDYLHTPQTAVYYRL